MPIPPEETQEVEFHMPSTTVAFTMLFTVVATAFFACFTFAGHGPAVGMAAGAALVFAYGTVRYAVRLITGQPWAVLMGDGMTFAFTRTVTWDEVKSVAIVAGASGAAWKGFISVELHDPNAYLERISRRQRRNALAAMRDGRGPIRLPGEAFPVSLEDVVATMRQFNPDLVVAG